MKADKKDVEVLCVRVGSVKSQGNDVELSLSTPDSRTMAAAALNRVGSGGMVVGYWGHAIPELSTRLLPRSIMTGLLVKTMRALRQKDNAKRAKQT